MLSKKTTNNLSEIAEQESDSRIEILKQLAEKLVAEVEGMRTKRPATFGQGFKLEVQVEEFEMNLIRHALLISHGHQRRAASLLGINPTTLNHKIKRYKINEEFKPKRRI